MLAKRLFIGMHGSEDPAKATLPFLMADGATQAGHQAAIILVGGAEASYIYWKPLPQSPLPSALSRGEAHAVNVINDSVSHERPRSRHH